MIIFKYRFCSFLNFFLTFLELEKITQGSFLFLKIEIKKVLFFFLHFLRGKK
jgi:hypothetical protein